MNFRQAFFTIRHCNKIEILMGREFSTGNFISLGVDHLIIEGGGWGWVEEFFAQHFFSLTVKAAQEFFFSNLPTPPPPSLPLKSQMVRPLVEPNNVNNVSDSVSTGINNFLSFR